MTNTEAPHYTDILDDWIQAKFSLEYSAKETDGRINFGFINEGYGFVVSQTEVRDGSDVSLETYIAFLSEKEHPLGLMRDDPHVLRGLFDVQDILRLGKIKFCPFDPEEFAPVALNPEFVYPVLCYCQCLTEPEADSTELALLVAAHLDILADEAVSIAPVLWEISDRKVRPELLLPGYYMPKA